MYKWNVRQKWKKLNKIRVIWFILILIFIIGLLILFIEVTKRRGSNVYDTLPCHYFESIDISGGVHQSDGSFKHKNITYPKGLHAEVDFVSSFNENGKTIYEKVKSHYRGCICNITNCLFICYEGEGTKNCKADVSTEAIEHELNEEFNYTFYYRNEKSCPDGEEQEYQITNGEIFDEDGDSLDPKSVFITYNINSNETSILQCNLGETEEIDLHNLILPYFMFTSVVFIIATFFVYICLPELRNLHGKCLLCYLLSLAIGLSLMGWVLVNGTNYVEPSFCQFVGYFMYFSFQLAFFWLNVICFDLYWNFRRTSGFILSERKRFFFYTIYAWGSAIFLTILIFVLDQINVIPEDWRPGIGSKQCFLGIDFLRRFLYMYLPLLILCTLNIGFFFMTALKIRQLQVELKKIESQDECRKHRRKLQKDKDNVTLFLRLFIVMGVGWIMEVVSYIFDGKSIYFILFDIWNCSAGILIFICMVLKRRVFRLMKKRWNGVIVRSFSYEDPTTYSSTMTGEPNTNMRLQRLTSNISVR